MDAKLKMIADDPWLDPVAGEVEYRHKLLMDRLRHLERSANGTLSDFANAHRYFGFQREERGRGWWFREWLPGAREVYLFGEFNDWNRKQLPLYRDEASGVWSIFLSDKDFALIHGSLVKLHVIGDNGARDRIPAYARRVVQDERTKNFTAQFWNPGPFDWQGDSFEIPASEPLLIYEAHVGMAQESPGVGTYSEFTENILPRIKRAGYNTVQLMAVAEHPYYGSFGYHVSNFYAPSSRFGTPEELKELIRTAHAMGLAVVMDLVHSHYVKNTNEGLNELDGTDHHYSRPGTSGDQPYWDSKLFDYGKDEVTHFLLSNIKYWLEEFHFDGFRFDGVTSMVFHHHGYTEFDSREKFFDESVNRDSLTYLGLANYLTHSLNPKAVTIAEDVSGMPGMCFPIPDGGVGFDYRLAMAEPDFWIELLEDYKDEQWDIGRMWSIMTDRLPRVGTIAYAESHDQALVGDKTLAFRLIDKEMYTSMEAKTKSLVVDRGMALHKMIRLLTLSAGGNAYLNFMGNEFGHPEWIDFPREGNGWSYAHARRQWSLADDDKLKFHFLGDFDREMLAFEKRYGLLKRGYPYLLNLDHGGQTMVFSHGDLLFVFNFHPTGATPDYVVPVNEPGRYRVVFSTDEERFGGQNRQDPAAEHFTYSIEAEDGSPRHLMKIYNICRTAVVYRRED